MVAYEGYIDIVFFINKTWILNEDMNTYKASRSAKKSDARETRFTESANTRFKTCIAMNICCIRGKLSYSNLYTRTVTTHNTCSIIKALTGHLIGVKVIGGDKCLNVGYSKHLTFSLDECEEM